VPELVWQPSLLGAEPPKFDPTLHGARRRFLGAGAWIDLVPGWFAGADALFDDVLGSAPWREPADRPMYDRIVAVPRMIATRWEDVPPVLRQAGRCLGRHYGRRLRSITANLYRNGDDSVAWHGDKVRHLRCDTVIGILSLGSPRKLLLRPTGGGPSVGYELHGGDLLVMGGTCQTTWEHCIPKRAHAGPRVSVMFREPGVS
jgi:alkylated DNA repair dioxygenase AlkB